MSAGLTYLVYRLTGSTPASGIMLLAWRPPQILLSSLAGVLADRRDRRLTMVFADLLLAAGLFPLLLVHDAGQVWVVYLVAFWEGAVEQFFTPAQAASVPHLVPLAARWCFPRCRARARRPLPPQELGPVEPLTQRQALARVSRTESQSSHWHLWSSL